MSHGVTFQFAALQWANARIVRWICGAVTDRFICNRLKENGNRSYNYTDAAN